MKLETPLTSKYQADCQPRFTLWRMGGIHRRRKRRPTTDEQYAKMLARMLTAWKPRLENDPMTGLGYLRGFQHILDELADSTIHQAIDGERQPRLSPTAVAEVFGVSRQAVYKRAAAGAKAKRPRPAPQSAAVEVQVAQPRELTAGQ